MKAKFTRILKVVKEVRGLEDKLALVESRLETLIEAYGEVVEPPRPNYETRKTLAEILGHKFASAAQFPSDVVRPVKRWVGVRCPWVSRPNVVNLMFVDQAMMSLVFPWWRTKPDLVFSHVILKGAQTKINGDDRPKVILPYNTYNLSQLVTQMEEFGQLAARNIHP